MANREITTYPNTLTTLLSSLKAKQRGITTDSPADPNNETIWEQSEGQILFKDSVGDGHLVALQKTYDSSGATWTRRSNVFADLEVDELYTEVGLIDQYLGAAIPISETGVTTLDAGFTATSIVGCLNELLDSIVTPDPFWKALSSDTVSPREENGYDYVYVNSGLKDQYCSGIALAESGETGLDPSFTATSIIGALNEIATIGISLGTENKLVKFGAIGLLDSLLSETANDVIIGSTKRFGLGAGKGGLTFTDAATNTVTFDSCNVGVGTAAPGYKTDIQGGVLRLVNSNPDTYANRTTHIQFNSSAFLTSYSNKISNSFTSTAADTTMNFELTNIAGNGHTTVMTLLGNGNVGIGTTAPIGLLDLWKNSADSVMLSIRADFAGAGRYAMIRFGDQSQLTYYQKGAIIYEGVDAVARGKLHFALDDVNGVDSVTLADAKMTILYTGSVGIGTTAPLTDVGGSTGDFDTLSKGLHIKAPSGYNARLILEGGAISSQGYRNAANSIIFCNTTESTANNRMFLIGQDNGFGETADLIMRPINADGSLKSYSYGMSTSLAKARYLTKTSDAVGYALQLYHDRSGGNLSSADVIGSLDFIGYISGSEEVVGQIESRYYAANGGAECLRFLTNGTLAMYIEDHGGGVYIKQECDVVGYLNAKDLLYVAQRQLIGGNYGAGYDPLNDVGSATGDFASRSYGLHIRATTEYQARLILEGESKCSNSFTNAANSIIFCNKAMATANDRMMLIGQDGAAAGGSTSDLYIRSLNADGSSRLVSAIFEQTTGNIKLPNLPSTNDIGSMYGVYYDTSTDKLYYYLGA